MTEWYLHLSHDIFFPAIYTGPETPPTNRSTIAKWMIKYVLRRCSWRCFTNTIMVMILRMTIARHSMMSTKSHGIHSDAADASELSSLLLMLVLLRVLVAMKFHSEGKTMLKIVSFFLFAQLIYSESTFFAAKQIVCNSYLNVTPSQENCPKKIWSDGVLKMISGLLEDLSKLTPVWLSWCLRISLLSLYNNLKANMRERLWGAL